MAKAYICIDLKSFYASVECIERGLDPLDAFLTVADESRTDKTICLAVSPALKAYGIPGRARLFELKEKLRAVNFVRRGFAPGGSFSGQAFSESEAAACPEKELAVTVAPPRMSLYMQKSTEIYGIYLRYIAPEDIHIYSVDEVFIDATGYLDTFKVTPRELASMLIKEVYLQTGITATAGVGTNLYLAKVAMDIVAKHAEPDENGARVAELDEKSCGVTIRLPIFGGWEQALQKDLKRAAFLQWAISRSIPCETRRAFTVCSVSTQSCSSTTRGAGSPAPWRR